MSAVCRAIINSSFVEMVQTDIALSGALISGPPASPVTAHATIWNLRGQRERLGNCWLDAMKGRVKASHLKQIQTAFKEKANWCEIVRLMQRRERHKFFKVVDDSRAHLR